MIGFGGQKGFILQLPLLSPFLEAEIVLTSTSCLVCRSIATEVCKPST
jgi:hypothetical protein